MALTILSYAHFGLIQQFLGFVFVLRQSLFLYLGYLKGHCVAQAGLELTSSCLSLPGRSQQTELQSVIHKEDRIHFFVFLVLHSLLIARTDSI